MLILDTGSGVSVLDTGFARIAGLERSGSTVNVIGTRPSSVLMSSASRVALGGVTLTDVAVAALDFSAVQQRLGRDVVGTIGYELFTRYVVTVDFVAGLLTLSEPEGFEYTGKGFVIPVQLASRVPVAAAIIETRTRGEVPARLTLDLGSSGYVLKLSRSLVEARGLSSDTVSERGVLGIGVGGMVEGDLMRFPALRLGSVRIVRPSAALSQSIEGNFGRTAQTDGTVGMNLFRRTRVIIDYARARVILEPVDRLDVADSVDATGITLSITGAVVPMALVSHVVSGSAAANAGVMAGDELVAVDGRPTTSIPLTARRDLFRAVGARHRLTLRRNGSLIETVITQRELF